MSDPILDLFNTQMRAARDLLRDGQFVQAGQKLGSAQTIALLHASSVIQYREDGERKKRRWETRRDFAVECADFAHQMQSSVEECGTMRITVGPEIATGITNISARMGVIPQKVLGMGLDIICFALDVIEDGHELRLHGPGLKASPTGKHGQGEML